MKVSHGVSRLEAKDLMEINSYLQHNTHNNNIYKISSGTSRAAQKLRQEIKALANSNCRIIRRCTGVRSTLNLSSVLKSFIKTFKIFN